MRKAEGPSRGLQRAAFKLPFITNLMLSHCCLPHLMPPDPFTLVFHAALAYFIVLVTRITLGNRPPLDATGYSPQLLC